MLQNVVYHAKRPLPTDLNSCFIHGAFARTIRSPTVFWGFENYQSWRRLPHQIARLLIKNSLTLYEWLGITVDVRVKEMQLNILIVGVLFPAIPLIMINFGNRYSLLAGLIQNLHDTVINEKISTDDSARFFRQIASLRHRLRLIALIQPWSALAFILNLSAMISLYFGIDSLGSWLFFSSIILMVAAMVQFTIEIQIANLALDVHLSDLEKHQEWQDYLASSKSRGRQPRKATLRPPDPAA